MEVKPSIHQLVPQPCIFQTRQLAKKPWQRKHVK